MVAAFVVIVVIWRFLPAEMAPLEDRSNLRVNATAQEGATYEYMQQYIEELYQLVKKEVPEAEGIISMVSPGFAGTANNGNLRILLPGREKRKRSQQEIAENLSRSVKKLIGARTFVVQQQTFGSRRTSLPVQYVIQAQDIEKLKAAVPRFWLRQSESDIFSDR